MIKILDNIIPKKEQEFIKNTLLDNAEFPWSFVSDVSIKDNKHQTRPGFKHIFRNYKIVESIINNTRKKTFILQNLKNITFEKNRPTSLHNLLKKITEKNNDNILDCNNNIYSKHLVRIERILVEIKGVINKYDLHITKSGLDRKITWKRNLNSIISQAVRIFL